MSFLILLGMNELKHHFGNVYARQSARHFTYIISLTAHKMGIIVSILQITEA